MHGSSFSSDGRKAIHALSDVFREVVGQEAAAAAS